MAAIEVGREQVLGYRFAVHQLDRSASRITALAVLALGLQDSGGSAPLIVDARMGGASRPRDLAETASLALVWSLRGAPHWHRRASVDGLAAALWPLSEQDAETRLVATGKTITRAGESALAMFAASAAGLRMSVTAAMSKGAASAAVTKAVPEVLTADCRVCRAVHISDQAMRLGSLPAGLELEPGTSPPVLRRRPGAKAVHTGDPAAFTDLVRTYLTLSGPAGPSELAWFFGARRADVVAHWPDDLVEVVVDGRGHRFVPRGAVSRLRKAAVDPGAVRLLAPFDPFLQTSDRDLLVPSRARQKQLWPVLGRPGAVLAGGEVIGLWRPKKSGATLTVTIAPFGRIGTGQRAAVQSEAERIGRLRGAERVTVRFG